MPSSILNPSLLLATLFSKAMGKSASLNESMPVGATFSNSILLCVALGCSSPALSIQGSNRSISRFFRYMVLSMQNLCQCNRCITCYSVTFYSYFQLINIPMMNRTRILLLAMLCFSFVSCKKQYECYCLNSGWGSGPSTYEIKAYSRSNANTLCEYNNHRFIDDGRSGCSLK